VLHHPSITSTPTCDTSLATPRPHIATGITPGIGNLKFCGLQCATISHGHLTVEPLPPAILFAVQVTESSCGQPLNMMHSYFRQTVFPHSTLFSPPTGEKDECVRWLDSQPAASVLFVTSVFLNKTKCKPICMPRSSFIHIVIYK
jgi:hypothetical protein